VVALHTLWDTLSNVVVFVVLAIVSLGWLFWTLHRYNTFAERNAADAAVR